MFRVKAVDRNERVEPAEFESLIVEIDASTKRLEEVVTSSALL
jgi:hypothetical protein